MDKSTNDQWLTKQCYAFVYSKLNDDILFEKSKLIRAAAYKRGITPDQVSNKIGLIANDKNKKN